MCTQKTKTMKHTQAESIRGFSLIEMMVSLTVFSIVMTISVGTLLIMVDANAKAQALYSSTTNLSFALDSMTREMRMGSHYYCPNSTLSSLPTSAGAVNDCNKKESIAFIRERDGKRIGYRYVKVEDDGVVTEGYIEQNVNNGGGWVRITSEDVIVETFEIRVENSDTYYGNANKKQPSVILNIKGKVNNGLDTATDFNIQTRIVQHGLDIF